MWCALVICSLAAAEANAPTAGREVEVRRLVRLLDAPQLAEREAAEAKLIEMGPGVLGLLPPPTSRLPAEVQQRLGRIRQQLQRQRAIEAVQAATVTLQGKIALSEALAAIQDQTGNTIADRRPQFEGFERSNPKVDVEFKAMPFWQALDDVLDQAGLGLYPYGENKTLNIVDRSEGQAARGARAAYAGPFRIEPVRVEAERDLRSGVSALRIALEVAWEPRLSPVSIALPMDSVKAVDDEGGSFEIGATQVQLETAVLPDSTATELNMPLPLPPRGVGSIERLSGKIVTIVPGKLETFRFRDIEKASQVEQRIAGTTVMLERVRKNNELWQVFLRIRFDEAGDSLASHRNWIFDNPVYLEGPDGERLDPDAYETTRQTSNEVGVGYLFSVEKPLAGYTLVYQTAGMVFSNEFTFELTGIPLP